MHFGVKEGIQRGGLREIRIREALTAGEKHRRAEEFLEEMGRPIPRRHEHHSQARRNEEHGADMRDLPPLNHMRSGGRASKAASILSRTIRRNAS